MTAEPNQDRPIRAGVFRSYDAADRAVTGLLAAGFPKGSVTVVCPQCDEADPRVKDLDPAGANTTQAAAAGSAIGALFGGATAAVVVTATGGAGLLVVGPLLGAGVTGAMAGGFLGAMSTRGIEPELADYYDRALQEGSILVAAEHTDEGPGLERAEEVFAACGVEAVPLTKD